MIVCDDCGSDKANRYMVRMTKTFGHATAESVEMLLENPCVDLCEPCALSRGWIAWNSNGGLYGNLLGFKVADAPK